MSHVETDNKLALPGSAFCALAFPVETNACDSVGIFDAERTDECIDAIDGARRVEVEDEHRLREEIRGCLHARDSARVPHAHNTAVSDRGFDGYLST